MSRLQLFLLLRRHDKLAFRRNPAYGQSLVARGLMLIGAGFSVVYLIFLGTMFGGIAGETGSPGFILSMMCTFLLATDFGIRFLVQQTPSMLLKPYMLLPIPRRSVVETFLLTSLCDGYNWLWLSLLVPYAFIVLCGGADLAATLCVTSAGMSLILANSQFYLLARTLTARSLLWWLLPIAVYGVPPLHLLPSATDTLTEVFGQPWIALPAIALLAGMLWLNRATQYRFACEEIGKGGAETVKMRRVSQFECLERFGQTGEYLKIELKSIMRNKAIRSRVVTSLALIVALTLTITYTDVYDGRMMLNFWCFYCFSIYGMTTLVKVMSPEGNYIDLLLTHRENILVLLRAKYYFHVAILFVPLVLMLPAIVAGKFPLLMVAAYMLLCSGFVYFMLFQMAVYNKQTLPLDAKITGKGNLETGLQLVIEMAAMLSPLALAALLVLLFDEQTAYWVLSAIGLTFTAAHPLWLRNVYRRMMSRKHTNLEGFHASR